MLAHREQVEQKEPELICMQGLMATNELAKRLRIKYEDCLV